MNSHSIGKIFLHLSWVLVLAGLIMLFNQLISRKTNPNQNPDSQTQNGVTEVILRRNSQHHYVANGLINGKSVTFLVDTGATNVSIGANLAEKLGLKRGYQGTAYTANGTTTTYATTLATLSLGDIQFNNVRASITMGMQGDEVLLGMSALKDVELIHKNGELTMRQYAQ
ncbi:retropepsin-like aspartic protease family protein [Marinagarivorans algicola]|uniref:retropepsin-like aspartic protease family protein n=1 Tax=Marinagarivorans algicola TaxID=1513270 RepID=UPI000ABB50C4|nr:TIGR02281 family clan AA aspartic protease [Marinagarivorans algicola]